MTALKHIFRITGFILMCLAITLQAQAGKKLKIYGFLWATNETPAIGKQVALFDKTTGQLLEVTKSNLFGKYKFKNLKPGAYIVRTGKLSRDIFLKDKNANEHFHFQTESGEVDFYAVAQENAKKLDAAEAGPTDPALAQWIAGEYYSYEGSTERKLMLCPGGVFYDTRESSYSGTNYNSLGNETSSYGAASADAGNGRWSIQGNKQQGTITFAYKGRSPSKTQYRVLGDNCIKIGGTKFCFAGKPRCQ